MSKWCNDNMIDAALNYIKNNSTLYTVCNAMPTTYAEAAVTYKLADTVITSSDFTGPANGDVSGRKVTINEKNNVLVDSSGIAAFLALCKASSGELLYVTECAAVTISATQQITIPAWDIEIYDPQ